MITKLNSGGGNGIHTARSIADLAADEACGSHLHELLPIAGTSENATLPPTTPPGIIRLLKDDLSRTRGIDLSNRPFGTESKFCASSFLLAVAWVRTPL
jgi:hypothetical protein